MTLYMVSWILRAFFDVDISEVTQVALFLIIAFCTSFFRLTFNKRFFDLAKRSGESRYLFVKSHYSQFFIAVFFAILGCCVGLFEDSVGFLKMVYVGAAVCSALYLLYRYGGEVSDKSVEQQLTFKR